MNKMDLNTIKVNRNGLLVQFTIFTIVLMIMLPLASALSISNVRTDVSDRYAVVNWQTDVPATTEATYRDRLNAVQSVSVQGFTKNHTLLLSPLQVNWTYRVTVKSVNGSAAVNSSVNITTISRDTVKPFINIFNLPQFTGSTTLGFSGSTEPGTQVYVYVNDALSASGFTVTGTDGLFTFNGILLTINAGRPTTNTIKIAAIDPSGNRNEITRQIVVDKSPPGVVVTNIPSAWGRNSLTITGTTDEPGVLQLNIDGRPFKVINITSSWQIPVTFSENKDYVLDFYALDRAGNIFHQSNVITVDTTDMPSFSVRNSNNLDDLNPSYVLRRTVTGTTKPNATVVIFVNNKTTDQATHIEALQRLMNPAQPASITIYSISSIAGPSIDVQTGSYNLVSLQNLNAQRIVTPVRVSRTTRGDAIDYTLTDNNGENTLTLDTGRYNLTRAGAPNSAPWVVTLSKTQQQQQTTTQITGTNLPTSSTDVATGLYNMISTGQWSGHNLNYVTTADAKTGRFSVEIELETQYRVTEQTTLTRLETEEAWTNSVQIFAVDRVGRVASTPQKTIYYTRCGAGGYYTITSPTPSPATLLEPALREGAAMFTLSMDINWANSMIDKKDVTMEAAPRVYIQPGISRDEIQRRYNITVGQNLVNRVQVYPPRPLLSDESHVYALVNLNPTTYDFGADLVNHPIETLEFPLVIELRYHYKQPNGEQSTTVTQKKCIYTSLQVEPELTDVYNPRGKLKWLTDFIDGLLITMSDIERHVKNALTTTVIACGVTMIVQWIQLTFGTKLVSCKGIDIRNYLNPSNAQNCAIDYSGANPKCRCTDQRLQSCCESTLTTLSLQKNVMNLVCDRVLCPTVPTLSTHIDTYTDLLVKSPHQPTYGTTTASSQATATVPTGAESKCKSSSGPAGSNSPCEKEFQRAWGWNVIITWPYRNEYDMAYKAQNRVSSTSGAAEGLRNVGLQFENLCSADRPNKIKIVTDGRTRNNVPTAYRIQRVVVDNNAETVVDYGEYATSQTLSAEQQRQGSTLSNPEVVRTDRSFSTIYPRLNFDPATGQCRTGGDDGCRKAVSGLEVPNGNYKLPDTVMAAIASDYNENYVFNPTAGLISSAQAICLPAVDAYLINYANTLRVVNQCFKQIDATGEGRPGTCNALLSEVVCDFVIDAVECAYNTYTNYAKRSAGTNPTNNGDQISNLQSGYNVFNAIADSGTAMSETIQGRYGNTAAYNSLFNEDSLMHSMCIGAFGGDWNVDLMTNLLVRAVAVPVDSTCAVFPANRRFIGSNPSTGKTTYTYYVGGLLSAGTNLDRVSVDLVCSKDNSCTRYGTTSNPRGECDCFNSKEQTSTAIPDRLSMQQGDIFDEAKYITIQDSDYRYDKVKLTYEYKDNTGKQVTRSCEAQIKDDSTLPTGCTWNIGVGFRCSFDVGDRGTARFIEGPRPITGSNGQDKIYQAGDDKGVEIYARTEVTSPASGPITKYLKYEIRNANDRIVFPPAGQSAYHPLDEGVSDTTYPGQIFQIKQDMFYSSPSTRSSFNTRIQGAQSGFDVVRESLTGTGSTRSLVVVFPAKDPNNNNLPKYECHDTYVSTTPSATFAKSTVTGSNTVSANAPIVCGGISFRINDPSKINTAPLPVVESGSGNSNAGNYNINSYQGTAIFIDYLAGTETTSSNNECTSTPQDWKVKASIVHSTSQDGSTVATDTPVYADGHTQEKDFNIKVVCNPSTGTSQAQSQAPQAIRFNINPSTVNPGQTISVDYQVTSQTGPITSIVLRLINLSNNKLMKEYPAVVPANNALTTLQSILPIALDSNLAVGQYSLKLLVNGLEAGSKSITVVAKT